MTKEKAIANKFELVITFFTTKKRFKRDQLFTTIADALRKVDRDAHILGSPYIDAQQEAIAFAEFIGQQKVFNTLHADNKRYWDKMIGNGKYTTEQLFQEYLKQKK